MFTATALTVVQTTVIIHLDHQNRFLPGLSCFCSCSLHSIQHTSTKVILLKKKLGPVTSLFKIYQSKSPLQGDISPHMACPLSLLWHHPLQLSHWLPLLQPCWPFVFSRTKQCTSGHLQWMFPQFGMLFPQTHVWFTSSLLSSIS